MICPGNGILAASDHQIWINSAGAAVPPVQLHLVFTLRFKAAVVERMFIDSPSARVIIIQFQHKWIVGQNLNSLDSGVTTGFAE